jgi:hypothetical protein
MTNEPERGLDGRQMAESQMAELQNVRVLLEEARSQVGNLSEGRRVRLEMLIRATLRELDAQLEDLSR